MKFTFEADMYKGQCSHCPCHYNDMADNDRCGVDGEMTSGWVEELDCPLKESNEVEWHSYPQEKPAKIGDQLISVQRELDDEIVDVVTTCWWDGNSFVTDIDDIDNRVIAWADLPSPYEEKDK